MKNKLDLNRFWSFLWDWVCKKICKGTYKMPINPQFITYAFLGGVAMLSDILTFVLLYAIFKTPYVNIISYTVGTIVSFTLNAKLNFNVKNKLVNRYIRFWTISIIGAIWSSVLMDFIIGQFNVTAFVAKLLVIPIVLAYQYFLSKKLVYNK